MLIFRARLSPNKWIAKFKTLQIYGTQIIRFFNMVLTFEFEDETLAWDHSNESRIEQYFHVVLFTMLHKVVLNFKSVDETLVCKLELLSRFFMWYC